MTSTKTEGSPDGIQPRTRSRAHRVLLWLTVVTLLLTAAAVTALWANRTQRTRHVQSTVDASYAASSKQAGKRHHDGKMALSELLGPVALHASSVTCVLNPQEAGLMVQSYAIECAIRTVDIYRTELTYRAMSDELEELSAKGDDDPLLLGSRDDVPTPPGGCGFVRAWSGPHPSDPTVTFRHLAAGSFDPSERAGVGDHGCVVPLPDYHLNATRVDSSYEPTAISPEYSWVTIERDTPFLNEHLGCDTPWLLCGLPISTPILPRQ